MHEIQYNLILKLTNFYNPTHYQMFHSNSAQKFKASINNRWNISQGSLEVMKLLDDKISQDGHN